MTLEQIAKKKGMDLKEVSARIGMPMGRVLQIIRQGKGILFNQISMILDETPEDLRKMLRGCE